MLSLTFPIEQPLQKFLAKEPKPTQPTQPKMSKTGHFLISGKPIQTKNWKIIGVCFLLNYSVSAAAGLKEGQAWRSAHDISPEAVAGFFASTLKTFNL